MVKVVEAPKMKTDEKRYIPPYRALAERLRGRIASEGLLPGALLGSEVAFAAESGLSRMTVRRAVQELIDAGIVERRAGRGVFVREKSPARKIAFLAGNLIWAPAVRVAQAVQEESAANGIEVRVFDALGDLAAFLERLDALPGSDAAGAVVMSQHDTAFNRALARLVAADFPFVVVDQTLSDLPGASVASDNRAGGRLAAKALLAAGHRHLAFLGDLAADTTSARAQGVADACAKELVPPPAMFGIPGQRFGDWEPAIRARVAEMLASAAPPTGLVCSCDAVARIAMRALASAGLAIPRDMSVTGFDDDPIAEWTTPALTTIRQDFSEMGRRAFRALSSLLEGAPPRHEAVPVSLVERGSVAPRSPTLHPASHSHPGAIA